MGISASQRYLVTEYNDWTVGLRYTPELAAKVMEEITTQLKGYRGFRCSSIDKKRIFFLNTCMLELEKMTGEKHVAV